MKKKSTEQTRLLKAQADKAKASAISKLDRVQQHLQDSKAKFSGFPMRFGILAQFAKVTAGVKSKPKAYKANKQTTRDNSDKCYDNQDLHLHRLKEIMHERDMPKRKVWNIKIPKSEFKKLYTAQSKDSTPISHHAIVQFPLKDDDELHWENTKIPQSERQYILTRITDFNQSKG